MKVAHSIPASKTEKLVDLAIELQEFVDQAAAEGESLYETEKGILAKVLKMGHLAVDRLLQRQGDGDLGLTVQTGDGVELERSASLVERPLRMGEPATAWLKAQERIIFRPSPVQPVSPRLAGLTHSADIGRNLRVRASGLRDGNRCVLLCTDRVRSARRVINSMRIRFGT